MTNKCCICLLLVLLMGRVGRAANFVVNQGGVGPVSIHVELTTSAKTAAFSGVGRNDSTQFIENAEFCMVPATDKSKCRYRFWKQNWAPAELVKWDVSGPIYPDLASYDIKTVALVSAPAQQPAAQTAVQAPQPVASSSALPPQQPPANTAAPVPPPEGNCAVYFGVVQYDPHSPAHFLARMTSPQAAWYEKTGHYAYSSACLSLERARYLIIWTAVTRAHTFTGTADRTTRVNTSTTGQETGTFNTYGTLSTWGTYTGMTSSESTSTITTQEPVPVTVNAEDCYVYVIRSSGPTIWDDIRAKLPEPPVIFSTEYLGPTKAADMGGANLATTTGVALGSALSHLVRKEPTSRALDAALRFVSMQPAVPPTSPQAESPKGMRNSDVLQLRQAGISDEIIIEAINSSAIVQFDLDAPHLIELHEAGLSDPVIQAMLRRSKPQ